MLVNKKVFITGGAGFIGSRLTETLVEHGNHVTVYDSMVRGSPFAVSFGRTENISVVEGDVLDLPLLTKSSADCDVFIHAAAIAGINATILNPIETMRVNLLGTFNALDAANKCTNLQRFVDFSTSEVFGSRAFNVGEEADTTSGVAGEARWTYAVSKLTGEHLAHAYYRTHGLPTVSVRPFNIYGPGQIGEGAMQIFIRRALKNEDLFIFGDGSQVRAWCYIDDFIDCVLRTIEADNAVGEIFNIGNSRAVLTILGLANTVCRVLNSKSKIRFKEPLSADIELRVPKTDKARSLLDFTAETDIENGILRTAEWIGSNRHRLAPLNPIFLQ